MKENSVLKFISELNAISKSDYNICLFLGAGVDVSSGGILFSDLKKKIVENYRQNKVYEQESVALIDKDFNEIIENMDDEERCNVIEYFIKTSQEWMPSDAYKLLLLMAKENCISSVITTNFSNLLEETQNQMGFEAFRIFSPATAIPAQYLINQKSPKAIYLKMHGDIDGKLITHLTNTELESKSYQIEFIKLFEHLIKNEVLIFLGYSGWDTKIAELFQRNISFIKTVYWCNLEEPNSKSPLFKIFKKNNITIKFIKCNFDTAILMMATELFKDKLLFHSDAIFILSFLKIKIQKLQTEFLKDIYTETTGVKPIKRTKQDILDDFILDENRNLCILTGNSGVGKSLLMAELIETYQNDEQIFPIPLNLMVTYSNNLLDYIVKKLGYVSKEPFTVLYQFSGWANEVQKDFIFIIDNLGNNIGTSKEIAIILNNLIELAYVVRTFHRVKFIVTLRSNIWNTIYQLLDNNYLQSIIWNDRDDNNNCSIRLGSFDKYEIEEAKKNLLFLTNQQMFPNNIIELMEQPQLYGLILQNLYVIDNIADMDIYKIFEHTFFKGNSKKVLEKLAFFYFSKYVTTITHKELSPKSVEFMRNDERLKNILSFNDEKISFKNNLVFEYSLASYLNSNRYIDIFLRDYNSFVQDYLSDQIPETIYQGIVRYCGIVCKDFGKVIKLLYLLKNHSSVYDLYTNKFINNVFKFMARYNAKQYFFNISHLDAKCNEFISLQLFIIHSTGFFKDDYAYSALDFLRNNSTSYSMEIRVLLNDRFTHTLRRLTTEEDIKKYFNNYIEFVVKDKNLIVSLFLLLMVMGRIARDNTCKNTYNIIAKLIKEKIFKLCIRKSNSDVQEVKKLFLKYAYYIFFNANDDLEEKYYHYPYNSKLQPIIKQVKKHKDLTKTQLFIIRSLINHFDAIEFFVCNIIFIYMATYNLEYAITNLDALYKSFDDNTTVLELDFYLSAVFLSCYVTNPLDRQLHKNRFEKVISDFETKLFISPSSERLASVRKFEDKFELEFEDGFNLLTNYTYTAPMNNYISNRHKETSDEYLKILWNLLDKLEKNGMYIEMVRLIQTINQMSVNWPLEGLEALSKFNKYHHPILRKAIIRTIEENYLRYPLFTEEFLEQTGEAFLENELLQIYAAKNSNIENRTLEQLVWARIIYFVKEYINPNILDGVLNIFEEANTLLDAFNILIDQLLFQNTDE